MYLILAISLKNLKIVYSFKLSDRVEIHFIALFFFDLSINVEWLPDGSGKPTGNFFALQKNAEDLKRTAGTKA
jgi:hypothetical protein